MNNRTLYPLLLLFNPEFMQCVSKSQIESWIVPCKVLVASTKRCWSRGGFRFPRAASHSDEMMGGWNLIKAVMQPSSHHPHHIITKWSRITFIRKWWVATIFTNLSSHQWTYWSYHHPLKLHVLNLSTSHQLKMRQLLKRDSIRVLNKSKKWCCKPKITTRNTISQNSK